MIRTRMLAIATTLAVTIPLGWAGAQTGAASTNAVGNNSPNVAQTGVGVTSSSSMTKQEIKQDNAMGSMAYGAPMSPSVAATPNYAASDQCDLRAVSITDEYGRKYNCRGDRIR